MKFKPFTTSVCGCLLVLCVMARAQQVPDAVQNAVDRQAERAQEQAAERAQAQARERVQEQAADRVREQTTGQVIDQVVERATDRAQEQATGRTQQQASERTQEQAADRVLEQTLDRVQGQAESAQHQALDRVQGGQAARVQEQLRERTQGQLERASEQLERVQEQAQRTPGQANGRARGVINGRELPAAAQAGADAAQQALERIPGPSPMAALPERLPIVDDGGDEVFVEVVIEPNVRALAREWVMLLTGPQRDLLIDEAPELMQYLAQTSTFSALESFLLKFRVPPDLDADDQILDLVPETLRELIDRNHVYSAQASAEQENPEAGEGVPPLPLPMNAVCEDPVPVGVIDSIINMDHPAFARPAGSAPAFVSRDFIEESVQVASGHGTAVAGVLIGQGQGDGYHLTPLLPGATIFSAGVVYSQDAYHQGATVMHLLEALSWMLEQDGLRVINMSLTGPANRLLAQAVQAVLAQGNVVVAAAGNDGPYAEPLYPAAYEGVVAATGVAEDRAVYRWAAQGNHVDFAALGVSVPTAQGGGGFGRESGTSMAAPIVSAFLACELASGTQSVATALERLIHVAEDLGATGHDPVFGHGLLHP